MGNLIINGTDITSTYGVVVSGTGSYDTPSRSYTTYQINGRNGDVFVDNGKFDNINITYPCYISSDFPTKFRALKSFLLSITGYVRIEDSYDTDHFREGVFVSEIVPETTALNRAGSFELTFNCKPQRWLKSGETKIVIDNSNGTNTMRVRPVNPTNYKAYPILYTNGNANIIDTSSTAVYCVKFRNANAQRNGFISAYGLATNRCKWDCESRNVYRLDGDTGNDVVNYGVYAFNGYELNSNGETIIDVYAGWKVEIEPRWWEI